MTLKTFLTYVQEINSISIQDSSPSEPKSEKLLSKNPGFLLLLFIIVSGCFLLVDAPHDPDFGWHLRYGEYFWQNSKLLTQNIISYNLPAYKWVNSYWGYEVIQFFLYSNFSAVGMSIINSLLLVMLIVFFVQTFSKSKNITGIVTVWTCIQLVLYNISVRPHLYSTIFDLILLLILLKFPKLKALLPLLFVVWANVHAEFVIGLFIWGVSLVLRPKDWIKEGSLFAISIGSTLINPAGITLWTTIFNELTLPSNSFVAEWSYLNVYTYPEEAVIYCLGAGVGILSLIKTRSKLPMWYVGLTLFFLVFSIKSTYFIRLFVLFCIIPTIIFVQTLPKPHLEDKRSKGLIFYVLLLNFLVLGSFAVDKLKDANNPDIWAQKHKYPAHAINYLRQNPISGNIFNRYEWGGFIAWQSPKTKTYIDGRMTQWKKNGNFFTAKYLDLVQNPQKNFQNFVSECDEKNITHALLKPDDLLTKTLINNSWIVMYEDSNSIVLKR